MYGENVYTRIQICFLYGGNCKPEHKKLLFLMIKSTPYTLTHAHTHRIQLMNIKQNLCCFDEYPSRFKRPCWANAVALDFLAKNSFHPRVFTWTKKVAFFWCNNYLQSFFVYNFMPNNFAKRDHEQAPFNFTTIRTALKIKSISGNKIHQTLLQF